MFADIETELDENLETVWTSIQGNEVFQPQRAYGCSYGNACNANHCDYCQWRKSFHRTRSIAPKLVGKTLWLVTFDGQSTDDPRHGVKQVLKAITKLTRLAAWRKQVMGGVRNLHLVRSETYEWNPHVHCIIEAESLDVSALTFAWSKCSGSQTPVHVEPVTDTYTDRFNALLYVNNPAVRKIAQQDMGKYLYAIKGFRRYQRFGSWYRFPKAITPNPQPINISTTTPQIADSLETPQPINISTTTPHVSTPNQLTQQIQPNELPPIPLITDIALDNSTLIFNTS